MGVGDVSEIVPDNFTFERSDALVCHVHYYGSGAQVCVCARACVCVCVCVCLVCVKYHISFR